MITRERILNVGHLYGDFLSVTAVLAELRDICDKNGIELVHNPVTKRGKKNLFYPTREVILIGSGDRIKTARDYLEELPAVGGDIIYTGF